MWKKYLRSRGKAPFVYYVSTFLGFLAPLHPCKHVFSSENKKKLSFSDALPPTSADVIYEWFLTESKTVKSLYSKTLIFMGVKIILK